MNLHGIVSGAIGTVNPFETVAVYVSTGYSLSNDGIQTPTFDVFTFSAQIQALGYKDLLQTASLNLQGTRRKMYFRGEVDGIVRMLNKGGDLVTRSDGTVWKVVFQLEQWPDWCSVVVTLQDGA